MRGTHRHDGVGTRGKLARVQVHVEGLRPSSAIGQVTVHVGENLFAVEISILVKCHLLAAFIHNRHTHISEEGVGKVGEVAHGYIETLRQGEDFFRLVGQTEGALSGEGQTAVVFSPCSGNGFVVGAIGVCQYSFKLTVEIQWTTAKFATRLAYGHRL